jgi:hypothetical protein
MLRKVLPLLAGGLVGLAPIVSSHRPATAEIICSTGYYLSVGQCVLVPAQPFVVAPAPVVVAPAPVIVAPVGVVGGGPVYRGGAYYGANGVNGYRGRYGGGAVSGPNGSYGVRGPGGATYVHTESHGNYYRR